MDTNKYTQQAREAVSRAQTVAKEYNHTQIEPIHLLSTLLEQQNGTVPQIVNHIEIDTQQLLRQTKRALNMLTRAYSHTLQMAPSRTLVSVTQQAEKQASEMKKDYVCTEHLFWALANLESHRAAGKILSNAGINPDNIFQALNTIQNN